MTALPNYTCFDVQSTFGVELPFEVVIVDVVKLNLPDADRYSRYGVMVNAHYNKNLVDAANITGSWKTIGLSKSDAERQALRVDGNAERFKVIQSLLNSNSRVVNGKEVPLAAGNSEKAFVLDAGEGYYQNGGRVEGDQHIRPVMH